MHLLQYYSGTTPPVMILYHSYADDQLVLLLRSGDEAAFTEIYTRYWQPLFRTAYHILQEKETAQDIIQNVFISLWQRKTDVEIISLSSYLRQATRFSVFKTIRESKNDRHFYERLAKITTDIITDNPLLFKEQQELLQQLIDSLPANCRETFRLSREENMTYKQIAELLGVSEKTVEKRITRCLRYIRSGLTAGICISILIALQ